MSLDAHDDGRGWVDEQSRCSDEQHENCDGADENGHDEDRKQGRARRGKHTERREREHPDEA